MYWEKATSFVNAQCDGLEPWQLVGSTFASTLLGVWLHSFLFQSESKYLKLGVFLWLGGRERGQSCWVVEGKRTKQGWTLVKTDFLLSTSINKTLSHMKVKVCLTIETPPFLPRVRLASLECTCICFTSSHLPFALAKPFTYCNTLLAQNLGKFVWELHSCELSHWCKVSG